MANLPEDSGLFNDFHAQIVHLGYDFCKAKPLCAECPVKSVAKNIACSYGRKHS